MQRKTFVELVQAHRTNALLTRTWVCPQTQVDSVKRGISFSRAARRRTYSVIKHAKGAITSLKYKNNKRSGLD